MKFHGFVPWTLKSSDFSVTSEKRPEAAELFSGLLAQKESLKSLRTGEDFFFFFSSPAFPFHVHLRVPKVHV